MFSSGLVFSLCFMLSSQMFNSGIKMSDGGTVMSTESKIRGNVTIGAGTIIQGSVTILADAGPIIISEGNIIEDQVVIINKNASVTPVLQIGNDNILKFGCTFESSNMSNGNILESRSYTGPGINLGSGVVVSDGSGIPPSNHKTILSETLSVIQTMQRFSATVISKKTVLRGDVTIGHGNIISGSARILAQAGPITIGDGNIMKDNVLVINKRTPRIRIGNGNILKNDCTFETSNMVNGNILGSKSHVGPGVNLESGQIIPDNGRLP